MYVLAVEGMLLLLNYLESGTHGSPVQMSSGVCHKFIRTEGLS